MIRWLTPEIGTASFEDGIATPSITVIDVRNMVDRDGNNVEVIRRHIAQARAALASGHRVILCCDHGISRSNAIAVAVIAQHRDQPFDDALRDVLATAEFPEMRVEVLAAVRDALPSPTTTASVTSSRVLLTGAAGGLGGELAATAPAGIELFLPPRAELDLTRGPAPIDLYLRRHGITRVLHFAHPRIVNTSSSLGQALAMLRNVLDACVANNAAVLYPSSWHIFTGHDASILDAKEDTPAKPSSCLGDAKLLCEILLAQYVERHGMTATVLRSGSVVGGGAAPHFMRTLCMLARKGEPITTHRYDNELPALDLLAASDYVSAAWSLFSTGESGIFHAGAGRLLTTDKIAQLVATTLRSSSRLHLESIRGNICNVRLNSGKLRQQHGWNPRIDLETTVVQFAESFICDAVNLRGNT